VVIAIGNFTEYEELLKPVKEDSLSQALV